MIHFIEFVLNVYLQYLLAINLSLSVASFSLIICIDYDEVKEMTLRNMYSTPYELAICNEFRDYNEHKLYRVVDPISMPYYCT